MKGGEHMASTGIQSVNTSLQQLFTGQTKTEASSQSKTGFSSVLDQSIQSKTNVTKTKQANKSEVHEVFKQTGKMNAKVEQSSETEVEETETVNILEEVINTVGSALEEACDELKEVLMNQMGITEEQLDEALETLGLTMIDLFDQSKFTSFFLKINGEQDMSVLLTDGELSENLTNLCEEIQTINPLEELQITPEDAKAVLEIMQNPQEEQPEEMLVKQPEQKEQQVQPSEEDTDAVTVTVTDTNTTAQKQTASEDDEKGFSSEQRSTKQETTKEVTVTVNGSIKVSTETKVEFIDQLAPTSQAKEIVEQIVQEIKVTLSTDQTSMEMVLTPETLGKVNLTVSTKDGVMTAHMVTETQTAKEAIESQIATLKDTLEAQGLKVDAVEVTVEANNFDFMSQSQTNQENQNSQEKVKKTGGKLRMMDDSEEEVIEQEERSSINASIGKGTMVDFSA